MTEVSAKTRARIIIIKLGRLINDQHGANITEPIVAELVLLLDPDNEILTTIVSMATKLPQRQYSRSSEK